MKIAVLIPCYNEAKTIKKVVGDFRAALPEADVYVYDNNSTDGTDEIARAAGAFLILRVIGYGLVAGSAWNGALNILQYVVPLAATFLALRILFRALKPRRRRTWAPLERLKARFA